MAHNQRETFKAIQLQGRALPEVVDKMATVADKLERLGDRLAAHQDLFHSTVKTMYVELADSVDTSHKENLRESVRLAGEHIQPLLQEAVAGIAAETQKVHGVLTRSTTETMKELTRRLVGTTGEVAGAWKAGIEAHALLNGTMMDHLRDSLESFRGQFERMAESLLSSLGNRTASWIERQTENDRNRLEGWTDAIAQAQKNAAAHLADMTHAFSGELNRVTLLHQASLDTGIREFLSLSSSLTEQRREEGENAIAQQRQIAGTLTDTVHELTTHAVASSSRMHQEVTGLLTASEELIRTRMKTEATWLEGHSERMEALTTALKVELGALREEEDRRGQAAVERLATLEATLASHLAMLGREIEAPMNRLIQTAASVPLAAADVISQLREEASKSVERDNRLLEEHRGILVELDTLSRALASTSNRQHEAIEDLVGSSRRMLEDIAGRFTGHVSTEASNFSKIAESFAVSAVEMASLGESFSAAVQVFNTANETLVENLVRIEQSLDKTACRSDEQLGYYVAQAREMVDHCLLSQKEIFEELQHLRPKNNVNPETSEWKN